MNTTTFDGQPATDVLAPADEAAFALQRATGTTGAIQFVWIYHHRVDLEALRRFHTNLRSGRLSRRIRRSPLPFGPPRWICGHDVPSYLRIGSPTPSADARQWLDQQAQAPLDPERGPAWRLAVLPFTDGGAVVSLVVSRCIADGAALNLAVTEAIAGWDDEKCGSAEGSRSSAWTLLSDIATTARRIPAVARATRTASRTARQRFAPAVAGIGAAPVALPTATVYIDAAAWDEAAAKVGDRPTTLIAGLAADVARQLGRTENGTVNLRLSVDERVSSDDTRANAHDNLDVSLTADADLVSIGDAVDQALTSHRKIHDPRAEFPPLPLRVIRNAPLVAVGGLHKVVTDNLGGSHPVLNRPDGTEADSVYARSAYPGVTKAAVDRIGGVLTLTVGRIYDRIYLSVVAYHADRDNDHGTLHQIITDALATLGLSGTAIQEVPTC